MEAKREARGPTYPQFPCGDKPSDNSDSRRAQGRWGPSTLESAGGYAEEATLFTGHGTDFLMAFPEAEGFEVLSQQPINLSVTKQPETKRHSKDHRTLIIMGAKVTNRNL